MFLSNLKVAIALVAFVCSSTMVQAQTPAHCAQRILAEAGYDPGVIDGQPGRGTKAASEDYLEAHPEVDLPPLTSSTAEAWCAELDVVAVLYGTPFTVGGDLVTQFYSEGVYQIRTAKFSNTLAITGKWGNFDLNMSGAPMELSDEDLAWPARLLTNEFYPEQFGYRTTAESLDPEFMVKLAQEPVSTYKVVMPFDNGETRTDLVFVGVDGVHRGIVFFTAAGMDRPDSFYQVASLEVWMQLGLLPVAADWSDLGIDPPQPGS
jgi:hypothetical protein